ncbi:MAG: Peptidase [Pedosphaera sp.]|nr:Peptidase [Pedosphaera sp.]
MPNDLFGRRKASLILASQPPAEPQFPQQNLYFPSPLERVSRQWPLKKEKILKILCNQSIAEAFKHEIKMTFDLTERQLKSKLRSKKTAIKCLRNVWWPMLAVLACSFGASPSHSEPLPGKMLKVFTRDEGGLTHFFVQNLEAADVTATFDMQLLNMEANAKFPFTSTIAGNQTIEAFTLQPVKKDFPWNYSYTDSFTIGNNKAVHDDSYVYSLPYAAGNAFRVTQGYHGNFSHTGPDEYATDWKMPIGTPIHAARSGVVVKAKDDSNVGGPDRKYENSANCILIQHTDGTIGIYAHLKKGGNVVKVGDKVNVGDLIGHSGNTGFTSGPHLHFSVFKTKNGKERVSLPVKFRTTSEPALILVGGQTYKAAPVEIQQAKLPKVAVEDKGKGS